MPPLISLTYFFIGVFYLPFWDLYVFMLFLLHLPQKSIVVCSLFWGLFPYFYHLFKGSFPISFVRWSCYEAHLQSNWLCLWHLLLCWWCFPVNFSLYLPSFSEPVISLWSFIMSTLLFSWVLFALPSVHFMFSLISLNLLYISSLKSLLRAYIGNWHFVSPWNYHFHSLILVVLCSFSLVTFVVCRGFYYALCLGSWPRSNVRPWSKSASLLPHCPVDHATVGPSCET